jgi:hypothetical protein
MPRMCAVGSSQETSIAASTPAGVGGSLRTGSSVQPGARRVAGGRSRSTMLGGGGSDAPARDGGPTRGLPGRYDTLLAMER